MATWDWVGRIYERRRRAKRGQPRWLRPTSLGQLQGEIEVIGLLDGREHRLWHLESEEVTNASISECLRLNPWDIRMERLSPWENELAGYLHSQLNVENVVEFDEALEVRDLFLVHVESDLHPESTHLAISGLQGCVLIEFARKPAKRHTSSVPTRDIAYELDRLYGQISAVCLPSDYMEWDVTLSQIPMEGSLEAAVGKVLNCPVTPKHCRDASAWLDVLLSCLGPVSIDGADDALLHIAATLDQIVDCRSAVEIDRCDWGYRSFSNKVFIGTRARILLNIQYDLI